MDNMYRNVIIGIYENSSIFGQNPDPEYDHIVPVFGVSSKHDLKRYANQYFADDTIYIHDNFLYTGVPASTIYPPFSAVGCYHYAFAFFQKSRAEADGSPQAGIYSVSNNSNYDGNYGVAITGVEGNGVDTLIPITIQTNPNYETPDIQNGSNRRPIASPITLNVNVSGMKDGEEYILLEYLHFRDLPKMDNFNQNIGHPVNKCIITTNGSTDGNFTFTKNILSDQTTIYRALAKSVLSHHDVQNLQPCK